VISIFEKTKTNKMRAVMRIQTRALKAIHDYMFEKDVTHIMPLIMSTFTDPLAHDVDDAEITYKGQKLKITKSLMPFKPLVLSALESEAIYTVSPCVRFEQEVGTKRHLLEFSQVDIEMKEAKKEDFMRFMEGLIVYVFSSVKADCREELALLGRSLRVPKAPFKIFEKPELEKKYGADFEAVVSKREKGPFWILDHKREFYDKEDPGKPGSYLNYDLVYPEGFGEALSGGEREYEYERILLRMERSGIDPRPFAPLLDVAKEGILLPTAGGGLGVERLVRYLAGAERVEDVVVFPKVPGRKVII